MRRSLLLVRLLFLAGCATGDSPDAAHEDAVTQVVLSAIALEARDHDPRFLVLASPSCALSH